MKAKKIIITGGTGFIGQELLRYYGKDNDIVILGRKSGYKKNNSYHQTLLTAAEGYRVKYLTWDGKQADPAWQQELEGADLVINLAGKTVNCRYHRKQKKEIIESRVAATHAIGEAIRQCSKPPAVWINGASTTIYRNEYESPDDEINGRISLLRKDNMPANFWDDIRMKKNRFLVRLREGRDSESYRDLDHDFSISVCKAWESAFLEEDTPHTRKIILRTAITLGRGGVITPFLNLCKWGLGGKQGSGKQYFSWIHSIDLCRLIGWIEANPSASGIYNAVAPKPILNNDFMSLLRKKTGNRLALPALVWLLEFGAWLIGTETELILKSRWAAPGRSSRDGFLYTYDTPEKAIDEILSGLPRKAYRLF